MVPPVRKPHVAGDFYPAQPETLQKLLADFLEPKAPLKHSSAVILPHAGYIYSGKTAGQVMRQVQVPDVCFLIGPHHRGEGSPFALFADGAWETPLGRVPIDRDFAAGLLEASHDLTPDSEAHQREHSLEVEVPFLQYRNPKVKIVPLVLGTLNLDRVREVALSLIEFLKSRSGFLIVASSDMSHYESDAATREKDRHALQAIEALDEEALARAVVNFRITMCGFAPVYMTLILAKALGARRAALVNYTTSAEVSGDYDRVVGYAGFIID